MAWQPPSDWPGAPIAIPAAGASTSWQPPNDWPGIAIGPGGPSALAMPSAAPADSVPAPGHSGIPQLKTDVPGKLLGDATVFDTGDAYLQGPDGKLMPTNNSSQMVVWNPDQKKYQVFEKTEGKRGLDVPDLVGSQPLIGPLLHLPQLAQDFQSGKPGAMNAMGNALSNVAMTGPLGAPPGAIGSGFTRPPTGRVAPGLGGVGPAVAASAERTPGQLFQSANDIGMSIPSFIGSPNLIEQRMAGAARELPGPGGAQVTQSAMDVASGLGDRVKLASQALGAGSQEVAGGEARDALAGWIHDGVNDINDRTYSAVDKLVDPTVTNELTNTAQVAQDILARRANATIQGPSQAVGQIMDAVTKPGGLNYAGVKDLRTYVNDQTPQALIAQGINGKEQVAIKNALTTDLQATIQKAGGEPALAAWQRANSIAQQAFGRRDQLTKIIGTDANATPVSVYGRLMAMAGSKQGADIAGLAAARKAMGPEAWNEVASAKLANMGRDAAGTFSPDRFRTEYGNLSADARDLLFRGTAKAGETFPTGSTTVGKAVSAVNDLATAYHNKLTEFSNTSRTAGTWLNAATAMSLYAHPIATISGLAGGKLLANMVTKPVTAPMVQAWALAAARNAKNSTPVNARAYRVAATNLQNLMQSNYAPPAGPLTSAPLPTSGGAVTGSMTGDNGGRRLSPIYAQRGPSRRAPALSATR